jgi:hypothetical protein
MVTQRRLGQPCWGMALARLLIHDAALEGSLNDGGAGSPFAPCLGLCPGRNLRQDGSGAISPFIWWHNGVCKGMDETLWEDQVTGGYTCGVLGGIFTCP